MRRWFWRLPSAAQRAILVGIAVAILAVPLSMMIWAHHFNLVPYFGVFGIAGLLLQRAFGGSRFKGLSRAGERLGVPFDASTATLQGRVRGVFVRVVPERGGKIVAYAPNGRGDVLKRTEKNDPLRGTSENRIVQTVEALVGAVEGTQGAICERAATGTTDQRRAALRQLATIPADERIPRVDEVLSAAARDPDAQVRLTASVLLGRPEADEADALASLALKRPDEVREAAAALQIVGSVSALAALVAARDLAPAAVDAALAAIRGRTGVEAGGLAIAETPAAEGALSIAARGGALTLKR